MSQADPPYAHGDIVLVAGLLDPQGRNPKDRPCVVITNPESRTEGRQFVVAISTVLPDPLPDDHVLLPYMNPRHPKTGLNKRNAAIGRWVGEVDESQIIRKLGFVPGKQIRALAEILARLDAAEDESAVE